jgi:ketosteroid isomerase-like protein
MNNIDIAKQAYADFSRGDIPAVLEALDDGIEWITPGAGLPTAGVRHGKSEVAGFFKAVNEPWDFHAFEPREYLDAGDQLAVRGFYDSTSRQTGRRASSEWVMMWKFKDGKVTHFQEYTDTAALQDALTVRSGAGA